MNIIGIGCDICEVDRVNKLTSKKYLDKFLTQKEIDSINFNSKHYKEHIAGRFASKEAIVKALGTGFHNISATDIEITNDELGKPVAVFLNEKDKDKKIMLSISHTKKEALAYATVYSEDN